MAHPTRRHLVLGGSLALAGCALPVREPPVPRGEGWKATVLGLPNERFRPDRPDGAAAFEREATDAIGRAMRHVGVARPTDLPPLNLLAVSGGGEDGAFGAGLLNGWTESGTRPRFDLVSGVSTGALTAPFAFLGPAWDAKLKRVYTDITPERVLRKRWFTAAIWDDALTDTAPLFNLISEYVDEAMLAAIAVGHAEGRLLLVASADLDAQVPVVWNIGAIAASGHPRALDTVRRVLLASAAIPGAFPPVLFDVTVDGRPHQELHVDGGTFAQAFLYPASATRARRATLARNRSVVQAAAWVIRNGRLDPNWAETNRRTMSIAGRAVQTMIATSGFNDVLRTYFMTQRDRIDFNLAYISRDFTVEFTTPFEASYMQALSDFGHAQARRGFDWVKVPPGAA
jgi:predicted acylesterase/phospholipase RssA